MAFAKRFIGAQLLLSTCLALSGIAEAQSDQPTGPLSVAYQQALLNDPTFLTAEQQLQVGLQSKAIASAFLRPRVDFVGSASSIYQDVSSDFFGGFTEHYIGWAAQLQVTGPLWHRELKAIVQRGDSQETLAQTQFALAGQLLVQRLSEAYFDLLASRAELDYANGEVKSVNEELRSTRIRYNAGAIARTGLDEARARSDIAEAAVISATTLVENANDALREIIGFNPDVSIDDLPNVPTSLSPRTPQPEKLSAWLDRAMQGNLEIMQARQQAALQLTEIAIARAELSPRLDYSAQLGVSDQSQSMVGQERYANEVGLQLTVPIYAGGGRDANIRVAEANRNTAEANVRRVQARVQLNTQRTYRQIQTLKRRDTALAKAITSAKSALAATRAGYDAGSRTLADVLDAKLRLLAAQRDAALLRYEYLRSSIALQQLVGELGPGELRRLDQLVVSNNGEEQAMAQLQTRPTVAKEFRVIETVRPPSTGAQTTPLPFNLELQRNR